MLEGLICPACENTIEEIDLRDSIKCPHCATDLKNRKYLDFLEFLMANGIVENLDFFDQDVYSCLLYTSPSPRDATLSRMPSSA